jgi:uncharacterized protein
MPILEKINQHSRALHWTDSIPLEYHYTAGVAGEEFRRELKQHGKFLTSKCPKCKTSYLPARMFCPTCFVETKERSTVNKPGYVYSYTAVSKDRSGKRLQAPVVVAMVKFEGVTGGIVHRLEDADPEKVTIGLKLEPVLKDSVTRTGALTDVLYFRPAAGSGRKTTPPKNTTQEQGPMDSRIKVLLEMIDDSGYPIGEEESSLSPIREKIGEGLELTQQEDDFLHRLADKAREWHRAEKTSAQTEPENTMSG